MRRIDLFIHPEFPFERSGDRSERYFRYFSAIMEKLKSSDNPIHVARDCSSDDNFRKVIPEDRRIIAYDDHKEAFTEDFDKLTPLCQKGDILVFHGTYYLQCILTFIGQVYAFVEHGFRWSREDVERIGKQMLTRWIFETEEMAKTGRYFIGIVYCYAEKTLELIRKNDPSWERQKRRYPHECLPF